MKLPRWAVGAMLTTSVLTVLVVAVWCWVEWPRATARRFVGLVAEKHLDEANAMLRADSNGLAPSMKFIELNGPALFIGRFRRTQVGTRMYLRDFTSSESLARYVEEVIRFEARSWPDIVLGTVTFTAGSSGPIKAGRGTVWLEPQNELGVNFSVRFPR